VKAAVTHPSGSLGLKTQRARDLFAPGRALEDAEILEVARPQLGLDDEINDWRADGRDKIVSDLQELGYARSVARKHGLPFFWSQLWLKVKRAESGLVVPLGLAGIKVLTDTGAGFIVDAFANTVEMENMKFHGIGTGSVAEAAGDTALGTELTTEYTVDNTRATGTTAEGASANIYQTVATNTVDAAVALREHGVLSQAATGGGVLLDRTVYALINLGNGDSLESTYELTIVAGS
jgi:hypothetical protein